MTTKKRRIGARIYPNFKPSGFVSFERVLLWTGKSWIVVRSEELTFGDIWRPCKVPSRKLMNKSKEMKEEDD